MGVRAGPEGNPRVANRAPLAGHSGACATRGSPEAKNTGRGRQGKAGVHGFRVHRVAVPRNDMEIYAMRKGRHLGGTRLSARRPSCAPAPVSTTSGTEISQCGAQAPSMISLASAAVASTSRLGHLEHQFVMHLEQRAAPKARRGERLGHAPHRALDDVGGGALQRRVDRLRARRRRGASGSGRGCRGCSICGRTSSRHSPVVRHSALVRSM